ncbi:MAG TPA: aspartate/glutamate racemase family protein [Burkholderiaceae bacterium]|nr:aspartate/glutamate racemase family protein [Burkholderiaceae bacterium]
MREHHHVPAHLGILMLATRFPRLPGDIGNPASFAFPVRYRRVEGASALRVVRERDDDLLARFVAAGRALAEEGAVGIATSCGFLAALQPRLAAALPVPVATSSLLQAAWIAPALPAGRCVGIVTIDADALDASQLAGVGAALDLPIEGVDPTGEFATGILGDAVTLDPAAAERDVVDAARRLVARRPDVAAIVLECTNMPPYRTAVHRATGRPVYDVVTMLEWFWRGLQPGSA